MDLKEQEILGAEVDTHWYYRAKSEAMLSMLGEAAIGEVLDVGAGSGFFARKLLDRADATSAVCVDPNYAVERSENHNGKHISFVRDIHRFDGNLVLMMDVLEHVADDLALLARYVALAGPGTRFLVTVPALGWMWSGHDVFLQHYRRYTLRGVEQLLADAGLTRLSSSYYFGLTLPVAAAARLSRRLVSGRGGSQTSDMRKHSKLVNALLWGVSRMELPLFDLNRVAGLSVFALAQRVERQDGEGTATDIASARHRRNGRSGPERPARPDGS